MNVLQAIKTRKSVRTYLDKDVENEKLTNILEMVKLAPSFLNRQEWRLIIIRNIETKKRLVNDANCSSFILKSPIVIVGCARPLAKLANTDQSSNIIDAIIALDHLSLSAIEHDLGTCWSSIFEEDKIKEILEIPNEVKIVALMSLGYPKDLSMSEKKRLSLKQLIKYEKW
jgi:nitroreductase